MSGSVLMRLMVQALPFDTIMSMILMKSLVDFLLFLFVVVKVVGGGTCVCIRVRVNPNPMFVVQFLRECLSCLRFIPKLWDSTFTSVTRLSNWWSISSKGELYYQPSSWRFNLWVASNCCCQSLSTPVCFFPNEKHRGNRWKLQRVS